MSAKMKTMLMTAAVATVLTVAARASAEATGSWSQLAAFPIPITNNAVASVCDGGGCVLYSFMGMSTPPTPSSITAASYKLLSPGTGPWIQIADAPLLNGKAKIAASAVTCNGQVYLIGGYTVGGGGEVTEHRLFRYDDAGDTYVPLTDVPTEVDDTVAVVYQDRYIYLISGWHGPNNNNTDAVQVYDTTTDMWQLATPIPVSGRFGHAGGQIGGRLTFIDGSAATIGFPIVHTTLVGQIDPGDPSIIAWTEMDPSPYSPTYRAANSLGSLASGRVLYVGGTDNPYNFNGIGYNGQPSNPLAQVMAYDPATDGWSLIDDTNGEPHTATMDHRGLVSFDGGWVTVGGMTGPGAPTDAVNLLRIDEPVPTASTWHMIIMALTILTAATHVVRRRKVWA